MARNKSGGFNKLLNFIGLVDDEDTRDTYGEEYSGDGYGRQSGYSPARQSRTASGRTTSFSRQTGSSRPSGRMPDSGSRSRYESRYDAPGRYPSRYEGRSSSVPSRATRGYDDYRVGERRTPSRFDDSGYGARAQRETQITDCSCCIVFDFLIREQVMDTLCSCRQRKRNPRIHDFFFS